MDKIKLSELKDEDVIYPPDHHGVWTVKEFKKEWTNEWDREHLSKFQWCLGERLEWSPDAEYMIESYIDSQYDSMYEDWDDFISSFLLDKEVIEQVQEVLDEKLKNIDTSYYEAVADVVIDID